jgi:TatD DNase family protein
MRHDEHRHEAKLYTDDVEKDMYAFSRLVFLAQCANMVQKKLKTSLESMAHPRNVGWGEIGLDYHYDNSPRGIQREVFSRQLRHAVRLGKPVTVHSREAEEDTERILKAEVPKDHKVQYRIGTIPVHRLGYANCVVSLSHCTCEKKKHQK